MTSTNLPAITELTDAELDAVAAAGGYRVNIVGLIAAVQTNGSIQTSVNAVSAFSGNQVAQQGNNVSVG